MNEGVFPVVREGFDLEVWTLHCVVYNGGRGIVTDSRQALLRLVLCFHDVLG